MLQPKEHECTNTEYNASVNPGPRQILFQTVQQSETLKRSMLNYSSNNSKNYNEQQIWNQQGKYRKL